MGPKFDEPPVDRRPIMRDESASIVMIAGANGDGNNVRQLSNEPRDFTRLLRPGLGLEHVEQITGNTNEIEVWSLFDQPTKPLKAEMKVGCDKKLHGFGKCLSKVVEMSSIVAGPRRQRRHFYALFFPLIVMNNLTVAFDPYAANHRDIVQAIVDSYCIASTGKAEWYPVAFFLRDENGEVLGGLLGDIWAAWLHVKTLAIAAPMRGHGFGRELMKRAETYAVERGCTDALPSAFRRDHSTKSSGIASLGRLKIIRSGTCIIS